MVRPLSGVHSLVSLQGSRVAETPPAVGTLVGLLSGVNPLVHLQCVGRDEGAAALGAHVISHTRVYVLVIFESAEARETLAADGAQERLLVRVNRQVRF